MGFPVAYLGKLRIWLKSETERGSNLPVSHSSFPWDGATGGVRESIPGTGRLIRSSGSLRRKGSGLSRRRKGQTLFLHCFGLVYITMYLAGGHVSP